MKTLTTILLLLLTVSMVNAQFVLEFDNKERHNVIVTQYYRAYTPEKPVTYGDFTIETWIKPLAIPSDSSSDTINGGYFVSQNYGGIHSLLFGMFRGLNGKYSVAGNFDVVQPNNPCTATNDTSEQISFQTPRVFDENVWALVAIERFGDKVTIYKNGVRIYQELGVTGGRISGICTRLAPLAQDIYIGGSDHINGRFRMSFFALWEGYAKYKGRSYVPHITPTLTVLAGSELKSATLVYDMTNPSHTLADISPIGFRGRRHPGILNSAKYGLALRGARNSHPQFVEDTDFPLYNENWQPSVAPTADTTLPSNTVVGDTFTRPDSNRFDGIPSLGTTEIGNKQWSPTISGNMVVIGGKFYATLPNFYQSNLVEAVSNGSGSIDRNGDANVGVRVRSVNGSNGIVIFTASGRLFVGRVKNSGFQWNHQAIIGTWNNITFSFNGSTVSATAGGTTVSWTDTEFQTATKAGLYCYSPNTVCSGDNFYITQ